MKHTKLILGDIFIQDVDAIVNPANTVMLHGGGLAAAITRRAGHRVISASQAQAPINTGEAIFTEAGALPFKGIIHAVGPHYDADESLPHWRRTRTDEDIPQAALLGNAYYNAMRVASEHGMTSVAFPAISCGVFRYPVSEAAPIAVEALRTAHNDFPSVTRSLICVLEHDHWQAFLEAMNDD